MLSVVSRSHYRDRDAFGRGFILLEWVLAAALGALFAVAVVAALIAFRRQGTTIAETARLHADAAVALRFLRHYLERAADPVMPGRTIGPRLRCETEGRRASEWFIEGTTEGTTGRGVHAPRWACDLRTWHSTLTIDYPADGDASWRDASNRPGDCQGASLSPRDAVKTPGVAVQMMRAALSIKVGKGDATPGLFCLGQPDVGAATSKRGSSAIVDGVERLVVWRNASFYEVCLVMRGRIRRASTPREAFRDGRPSQQASQQARGTGPRAGIELTRASADRCAGGPETSRKSSVQSDYVGTDGYRRHVIRVIWPVVGS